MSSFLYAGLGLSQGAGFTLTEADIKHAFDALDQKGDGKISMEEYVSGLQKLNLPAELVQRTAQRAFDAEIKAGKIENVEQGLSLEAFAHYTREYQKELHARFEKIDVDHSGQIDAGEWDLFLDNYGMSSDDRRVLFERIDLDHNGSIDYHEFCAWMLPTPQLEMTDLFTAPAIAMPKSTPFTTQLAAGMIAGIASRTATAPFDRARGMMASGALVDRGLAKSKVCPKNNVKTAVRAMYAEGVPFLSGASKCWRGNVRNC